MPSPDSRPEDLSPEVQKLLGMPDERLNNSNKFIDAIKNISTVNPLLTETIHKEAENFSAPGSLKFQLVVIDDEQFNKIAKDKRDFAMKMECGSCVPGVGDTLLFVVPDTDPAEQAYFACDITYVDIIPVIALPTHLYLEYNQEHPGTEPSEKVAYIVFEMNPELTIEVNKMAAPEIFEDED